MIVEDDDLPLPDSAVPFLSGIIDDLVARNFDKLSPYLGRLTSEEMITEMDDYGEEFAPVPPDAWNEIQTEYTISMPPDGNVVKQWHVDIPLWTKHKGRSDLILSLKATSTMIGWTADFENLHVM